jgi:hypothetical protein
MQSTPHITFEMLTDLAENRLSGSERATCLNHLALCSQCGREFGRLEHLMELMRSDSAEDAPRDLLAYAKGLYNVHKRQAQPSVLKRIVAALTFDSSTVALEFQVRLGQSPTRQLIFKAEDSYLDLRLTPQAGQWDVIGQLLAPNCGGGEIEIKNENDSRSAVLNDLCEFTFPSVEPGTYALRLRLSDIEIEVPRLEI